MSIHIIGPIILLITIPIIVLVVVLSIYFKELKRVGGYQPIGSISSAIPKPPKGGTGQSGVPK